MVPLWRCIFFGNYQFCEFLCYFKMTYSLSLSFKWVTFTIDLRLYQLFNQGLNSIYFNHAFSPLAGLLFLWNREFFYIKRKTQEWNVSTEIRINFLSLLLPYLTQKLCLYFIYFFFLWRDWYIFERIMELKLQIESLLSLVLLWKKHWPI